MSRLPSAKQPIQNTPKAAPATPARRHSGLTSGEIRQIVIDLIG